MHFCAETVQRLLKVYARQAARLTPEDRAFLRKFVERDMEASRG